MSRRLQTAGGGGGHNCNKKEKEEKYESQILKEKKSGENLKDKRGSWSAK